MLRVGELGFSRQGVRTGVCVRMAAGFGKEVAKAEGNRDQRRAKKKAENAAAKNLVTEDDDVTVGKGLTPKKVEAPRTLDTLTTESERRKEIALREKNIKAKGKSVGLPLENEVRQIPTSTLEALEKGLLVGLLAAGGMWILAGMGTAYDAYMIATKQAVPAGVDEALSVYVEPYLTPGLFAIISFSVLLGGLQVYKFEGGRK